MATGTIKIQTGIVKIIRHPTIAQTGSINSFGFRDIVTDITTQNEDSVFVARYCGNPHFVLANQWRNSGSDILRISIYNASNSSQSFDSGGIILYELYFEN